jgi:hypothetical protein
MNRRNFLGSLAVLPFFGSLVKAVGVTPEPLPEPPLPTPISPWEGWDNYPILTEEEIKQYWELVNTPCFPALGFDGTVKGFVVKTRKMKIVVTQPVIDQARRVGYFPNEIKYRAIEEIRRSGVTHVYAVFICNCPIYDPQTFTAYYGAMFRGATVPTWFAPAAYKRG